VTDHAATNEINLGPDRRGRWAKVTVPASRSFLLGRRHRPARTALWPIGGCGRRWCSAMGGCPTRARASSSSLSTLRSSRAVWCRRRDPTGAVHQPDGSEGVDLYLDRELFPEAFAADVDPRPPR
jgi:hypothetical protein